MLHNYRHQTKIQTLPRVEHWRAVLCRLHHKWRPVEHSRIAVR